MTFPELLEWQWSDYPQRHQDRTNLLILIVTVPLVWLCSIEVLGSVLLLLLGVPGALKGMFWALVLIGAALFAQSRGNAMEKIPPVPFKEPKDMALRLLAEQFVTFPRFVLSGDWQKNLQNAK